MTKPIRFERLAPRYPSLLGLLECLQADAARVQKKRRSPFHRGMKSKHEAADGIAEHVLSMPAGLEKHALANEAGANLW